MKLFNFCVLILFLMTTIECLTLQGCYSPCSSNADCGSTCPECAAPPVPGGGKICGNSATKTNLNNGADERSSAGNLQN